MNTTAYTTAKSSVGWRKYPVDTVIARGNDRLDLLQRLTTNDVSKLIGSDTEGMGVHNILLTDKARIIDVFNILARNNDLLLLFSEGLGAKCCEWLEKYTFIDDFTTEQIGSEYASILVFGQGSVQLLEELADVSSLRETRLGSWHKAQIQGMEVVLVKQQPLSEYCWLVLFPKAAEESMYELLRSLDADMIAEIDDATFETLRIEAAWGKHGTEWTDERNPLEAGLVGLVDFKKGCYIGQEVIARLDTYNKVKVRLSGFVSDAAIPQNARFFDESDGKRTDIGGITSTTFSPELQKYIALGYIRSAFANPGASIEAVADGYSARLEIVKLPFVM